MKPSSQVYHLNKKVSLLIFEVIGIRTSDPDLDQIRFGLVEICTLQVLFLRFLRCCRCR